MPVKRFCTADHEASFLLRWPPVHDIKSKKPFPKLVQVGLGYSSKRPMDFSSLPRLTFAVRAAKVILNLSICMFGALYQKPWHLLEPLRHITPNLVFDTICGAFFCKMRKAGL